MTDSILHLGLLEDEAISLDAAALELAALDHADVDLERYSTILGAITDRLDDLGAAAVTGEARAKMLARVIAAEQGFEGDRLSYDDPDNADLIRVIDRRRGLPVSLAIIYVAAARRLGWPADILDTPGHVLVRLGPDTAPVLIDPFGEGRMIEGAQLATLLSQVFGRAMKPTAEHLAPMSNRMVLVRLLNNQATRAETANDRPRARTLFERMTVVAPEHSLAWWQRARLEIEAGAHTAARASLSAMLETTRDPELRHHVHAALDAIAR